MGKYFFSVNGDGAQGNAGKEQVAQFVKERAEEAQQRVTAEQVERQAGQFGRVGECVDDAL